jgi:hypothetical protein
VQRFIALKNDQGSGLFARHPEYCLRNILELAVLGFLATVKYMAQEAETVQGLTNLGLKHNDYENDQHGAKFLKHPARHVQIKEAGCEINKGDDSQSYQYLNSSSSSKPGVQLVKQKGHNQYVGNILDADGRDHSVAAPDGAVWIFLVNS